jgi:hypothetical protein
LSSDVSIDDWLKGLGFGSAEARSHARSALEGSGLTRAGKSRLSNEKLERAARLMAETFFLHCSSSECAAAAAQSGRRPMLCDPKSACVSCGGSDNQRAVSDFLHACSERSVRRVAVIGGSPAVWEELERFVGDKLQLRTVDGTQRRTQDHARADLEWADLVLVWGATELHHKVSMQYTNAPAPLRHKLVNVPRRGIAALFAAGLEHLKKSEHPSR